MNAFIITSLKDRLIFTEANGTIYVTAAEYDAITGVNNAFMSDDGELFGMSVDYKGYDNKRPCVNDFIGSTVQCIDLSKLTVSQVTNLLKL